MSLLYEKFCDAFAGKYRSMIGLPGLRGAYLNGTLFSSDLPMPAKDFVCILDVVTTGLLFTFFQTPELITEKVFIATLRSTGREKRL